MSCSRLQGYPWKWQEGDSVCAHCDSEHRELQVLQISATAGSAYIDLRNTTASLPWLESSKHRIDAFSTEVQSDSVVKGEISVNM